MATIKAVVLQNLARGSLGLMPLQPIEKILPLSAIDQPYFLPMLLIAGRRYLPLEACDMLAAL